MFFNVYHINFMTNNDKLFCFTSSSKTSKSSVAPTIPSPTPLIGQAKSVNASIFTWIRPGVQAWRFKRLLEYVGIYFAYLGISLPNFCYYVLNVLWNDPWQTSAHPLAVPGKGVVGTNGHLQKQIQLPYNNRGSWEHE